VSGHKEPELVRTLDVSVPEPDFEGAQLVLTNVKAAGHFSYGADIYLTPADEELHPLDRDFRERYLADTLYFWKHLHHHGGHATPELDMSVDLTGVLKSLAAARPHERWRLSVALAASGDSHPQPEMLDFGDLTLNVY
jgi:hypothetical protein